MTERVQRGMLDTCAAIDLPTLDPARLPVEVAIPAIVLAELAQGVAMTKDPEQAPSSHSPSPPTATRAPAASTS